MTSIEKCQPLLCLPLELLLPIISKLSNEDLKAVRLTCSALRNLTPLRIKCAYISLNWEDIRVFRALADHEIYRHSVTEIIVDDGVLRRCRPLQDGDAKSIPNWFVSGYDGIIREVESLYIKGSMRPAGAYLPSRAHYYPKLSLVESYRYYQAMSARQHGLMKTNADELALEYGLKRFPNVRRLTITPVAHGLPFAPWYKTPTIRELPPGLVCRPPRSWPQEQDDPRERDALCWHFASERHHWRGFCALSNALAKQHHNKIVEFVVDVNKTCTGINCRLFDTPNSEYRILVNLFKNPGFSRIDLALFTRENPPLQWPEDRKRYLHAALAGAKDLAHFSLSGSLDYRLERLSNLPPPIMLSEVLPMTIWKQLRHFGLSRVVVRLDDLVDILSQLPSSLRSVDLSFLQFQPGGGGNYIELLYRIRDALGWSDRPVAERPRITIQLTKTLGGPWTVRSILDVSASVNRFVYEHGESIPFISNSDEQHTIEVDLISDGIERFPFMPIRDRPFWAHRISLPRFSRNF